MFNFSQDALNMMNGANLSNLLQEVSTEPELYGKPTIPEKNDLEDYKNLELKRLITESTSVPQFSQKLYEAQQLIEIMRATGNEYHSSKNVPDLKPIFRELFMSNSTH